MPEPCVMTDEEMAELVEAWPLFAAMPHECEESPRVWLARLKREVASGERKRCCGGVGNHEPGCALRAAELARSGRFDD